MARVVIGESAEEMRFGDFLEEFIFMVFRIEKLLRKVDYFQEPDEILIEDTTRFEPEPQEGENYEQQEEKGYEICTVMEDSNEDENEESGSSSRRNQKRSNQKASMLSDANQMQASGVMHDFHSPNFHGRSSFDGTQSQDSQSEKPRSLGEVANERGSGNGILGTLTPEKRISLKGSTNLYPNVPVSHLEETVPQSMSAQSQKRVSSNVSDLLNSLLKSPERGTASLKKDTLLQQANSPEPKPDRRALSLLSSQPDIRAPRDTVPQVCEDHGQHKTSPSKEDSFSHIMDLDSQEDKSLSQDDQISEGMSPTTPRAVKYGLSNQDPEGDKILTRPPPDERKNSKVCIIENLESQIYDLIREAKKVATNSKPNAQSFESATTIGGRDSRGPKQQPVKQQAHQEPRPTRNSIKNEPKMSQSPQGVTLRKMELIRRQDFKFLAFDAVKTNEKHSDSSLGVSTKQTLNNKHDMSGSGILKIKGQLAVAHGGNHSLLEGISSQNAKQKLLAQGLFTNVLNRSSVMTEGPNSKSRENSESLRRAGQNAAKTVAITQYHSVSKQEKRLSAAIQTITTPLFKGSEHVKHITLKTRRDEVDSKSFVEVDRKSILSEAKDSQSFKPNKTGNQRSKNQLVPQNRSSLSPASAGHQTANKTSRLPVAKQAKLGHSPYGGHKQIPAERIVQQRHQPVPSNLTQLSGGNPHFDSYLDDRSNNGQAERSCSIPLSDQQSPQPMQDKVLLSSREDIFVTNDGFLIPERTDGPRLRGSFDSVRGLDAALQTNVKHKTGNSSARSNGRAGLASERGEAGRDFLHESLVFKHSAYHSPEKQRDMSADAGLRTRRKQELMTKLDSNQRKHNLSTVPPKQSSTFGQQVMNAPSVRPRTSSNSAVQKPAVAKQKAILSRSMLAAGKPVNPVPVLTPRTKTTQQAPVVAFKPNHKPVDLEVLQKKLKGSVGPPKRREPSKLERSVHL